LCQETGLVGRRRAESPRLGKPSSLLLLPAQIASNRVDEGFADFVFQRSKGFAAVNEPFSSFGEFLNTGCPFFGKDLCETVPQYPRHKRSGTLGRDRDAQLSTTKKRCRVGLRIRRWCRATRPDASRLRSLQDFLVNLRTIGACEDHALSLKVSVLEFLLFQHEPVLPPPFVEFPLELRGNNGRAGICTEQ